VSDPDSGRRVAGLWKFPRDFENFSLGRFFSPCLLFLLPFPLSFLLQGVLIDSGARIYDERSKGKPDVRGSIEVLR